MGIYAQICFQNSGVTQAGSLMSLHDNDLTVSIIQIYNDASVERQQESRQRLFTLGHLPLWENAAMLAEARRCLDMDIKGFVLPDTPERLGIPSFVDYYWTPLLEMCEACGAPLNFHLNEAINPTDLAWKGFSFEGQLIKDFLFLFFKKEEKEILTLAFLLLRETWSARDYFTRRWAACATRPPA